MLRVNYRRYLAYFMCNTFSITLFYCFAALFTNDKFMNSRAAVSSISSNIVAPSVFVSIFIVLFVPYSHSAFQKLRQNDYGILLTLGMTEKEVFINMLFENGMIALASVIFGLLAGTVISICFYAVIIKAIGVTSLSLEINLKAYEVTILLYGVVFIITVIISIFQFYKMKVIDLIKSRYKADKEKKSSRIMFCIGNFMIILAVILMMTSYDLNHYNVLLYSMFICLLGIYLVISNSDIIIRWLEKNNKAYYLRNSLFFSNLKYNFHSLKKILIAMICLFQFAIFFMGISITFYNNFQRSAISHNPYGMEYAQMFGKNNISDENLKDILNKGDTKVTEEKSMEFLRNNAFNILSASQVNTNLNRHYNVKEGTFLTLFQYDLQDGYTEDFTIPEQLFVAYNNKEVKLKAVGSKIDILLDKNACLADRTIIVNNIDYEQMKKASRSYFLGVLKLFNFEDWKKSGSLVNALQQQFNKTNAVAESEEHYYKISSRLESYETAKQSSEFLLFVMFFLVILFCLSANIILHLKSQLELETERRKYSNLYKMGMQAEEMKKLVLKKYIFIFLTPVLLGAILAMFYNYSSNMIFNYGWISLKYSGIFSIIVIVIQMIFIKLYVNSYCKKLL